MKDFFPRIFALMLLLWIAFVYGLHYWMTSHKI